MPASWPSGCALWPGWRGPAAPPRLVLTTANAIVQKVPPPEVVRAGLFAAQRRRAHRPRALLAYLERNGYHRTSAVVEAGDYAVRGGLIDIFPSGSEQPVRLDFFGATLESIRTFDPLTQRSQGKVGGIELRPVSEVLLDAAAIERFQAGYLQRFGAVDRRPAAGGGRGRAAVPRHGALAAAVPRRLVPLFAYLDARLRDQLRPSGRRGDRGARGDRSASTTRRGASRPRPRASFGAAPYRPLPPEMLYLDEGGSARARRARRAASSRPSAAAARRRRSRR